MTHYIEFTHFRKLRLLLAEKIGGKILDSVNTITVFGKFITLSSGTREFEYQFIVIFHFYFPLGLQH